MFFSSYYSNSILNSILPSDSTTVKRGWDEPQIPSVFSASLVILALFVWYERRREVKGLSVIMPPSIWKQPGAKMPSIIIMVFFSWYV
jgi:hypothetical protein